MSSPSINDKEYTKFIDLGNGLYGVAFVPYALAVDGPDAGNYVQIKAVYNATGDYYELLTAGSGSTTTTDTTSTFLLESGSNFLLESGDELLLEA